MREFSLYDGAVPQAPQVHVQQLGALPQLPLHGHEVDAAVQAGFRAVEAYGRLEDYGTQAELERKRKEMTAQMQQEFDEKARLPWGADGSFYHEDGTRNEDEMQAFASKWQEENNKIGAGRWWLRENAVKADQQRQETNFDIALNLGKNLLAGEQANREKLFKDHYDLCVGKEDYAGARAEVDKAVAGGMITRTRGEVMKLGLARMAARRLGARARSGEPVSLKVGGREFSGASAALAAVAQRSGVDLSDGADGGLNPPAATEGAGAVEPEAAAVAADGEAGLPLTLGGVSGLPEVRSVSETFSRTGVEGEPDGKAGLPLTLGGSADLGADVPGDGVPGAEEAKPEAVRKDGSLSLKEEALSPAEGWFRDEDAAGLCRVMPQSEFGQFVDDWAFDGRIGRTERPDGGLSFSCAPTAPVCVQRVAAKAEKAGEITLDDAQSMVARMTMDALASNPNESVEHLVGMFKDSGMFEVFGQGDAESGEVRLRAVVDEYRERTRAGSGKLQMSAVEKMVDAHLRDGANGLWDGREWKVMGDIARRLEETGETKWKYDEAYGREWNRGYHIYKKYRAEFNPEAKGEMTDEEWQEKAPAFAKWYTGGSHRYRDLRQADEAAARDWYLAQVAEGLRDSLEVKKDGKAAYQGYAADVDVAREKLKLVPPADLGVDALADLEHRRQEADAERSRGLRKKAQEDFVRLRQMKQGYKENSEKAQAARKRAEDAEKRRMEKAQEAEEKRRAAVAARKLAVERRRPRQVGWVWDRKPSADGESPACTVPEEEYRRLVDELGWDGSQDVYLQVQGAKIQVVGTNRKGCVELNAPAALKVQKKPKKGESLRLQGDLGFSYVFKTYAN